MVRNTGASRRFFGPMRGFASQFCQRGDCPMVRDLAERFSLKLFNLVLREPALVVGDATPFSMVRPSLDSMALFHWASDSILQVSAPKPRVKASVKSGMRDAGNKLFTSKGFGVIN